MALQEAQSIVSKIKKKGVRREESDDWIFASFAETPFLGNEPKVIVTKALLCLIFYDLSGQQKSEYMHTHNAHLEVHA